MDVPGRWGRVHATAPLASLVIADGAVTFTPRWFGSVLFGPFRVPVQEVEVAFRLRGGALSGGVGIDTRDGQTAYFWTSTQQDEVLQVLAGVGVPVDPVPRDRKARRGTARGEPVRTPGAPLRPWLVRALPLLMVVGTLCLIVLEVWPAPLLWHLWIAIVGCLGLVNLYRLWRSHRSPD